MHHRPPPTATSHEQFKTSWTAPSRDFNAKINFKTATQRTCPTSQHNMHYCNSNPNPSVLRALLPLHGGGLPLCCCSVDPVRRYSSWLALCSRSPPSLDFGRQLRALASSGVWSSLAPLGVVTVDWLLALWVLLRALLPLHGGGPPSWCCSVDPDRPCSSCSALRSRVPSSLDFGFQLRAFASFGVWFRLALLGFGKLACGASSCALRASSLAC